MKNQSVSDFVAATMDAVLNSKEHKSLFATQYKKAGGCSKCGSSHDGDSCMADDNDARKAKKDSDSDSSSAWDDNDARKKKEKDSDSDSSSAWDDDNDARKAKKDSDSDSSDADDENDARKKKKDSDEDESSADDNYDDFGKGAPSGSGKGADPYVFPTDKITAQPPPKDAQKPPTSNKADDGFETSAAFDVAIDSLLTASAALDSVGLGRGSALTLKIASLVVEAKKKDKKSKDSKKSSKDSQSAKDKKSKDSKKDDKKSSSKDSHSAKDKKSDSKSSKDSKKSSK